VQPGDAFKLKDRNTATFEANDPTRQDHDRLRSILSALDQAGEVKE
jgi:hypothetical protein